MSARTQFRALRAGTLEAMRDLRVWVAILTLVVVFLTAQMLALNTKVNSSVNALTSLAQVNSDNIEANKAVTDQVADCITPKGRCAQRGARNGANLGAAIIVCTKRLPVTVNRDEAMACVAEVASAP